jgi:hypothetical protein
VLSSRSFTTIISLQVAHTTVYTIMELLVLAYVDPTCDDVHTVGSTADMTKFMCDSLVSSVKPTRSKCACATHTVISTLNSISLVQLLLIIVLNLTLHR